MSILFMLFFVAVSKSWWRFGCLRDISPPMFRNLGMRGSLMMNSTKHRMNNFRLKLIFRFCFFPHYLLYYFSFTQIIVSLPFHVLFQKFLLCTYLSFWTCYSGGFFSLVFPIFCDLLVSFGRPHWIHRSSINTLLHFLLSPVCLSLLLFFRLPVLLLTFKYYFRLLLFTFHCQNVPISDPLLLRTLLGM